MSDPESWSNESFDTGSDGVVLEHNMARLGVDPASLDLLMISHRHWDHTGGIYDILNANRNLRVCVPRSFSAHFKSDMKRYGAQIMEVKKAREILPGFFTTGELEGILPEQAALLKTSAGTVVITGCAHPGIVSIVETAKKYCQRMILRLSWAVFTYTNSAGFSDNDF
jgi:7,8-dihydropterin-6-yl-methyl-4-(beta-D-ribofuranosyl)aminobenzene 5'-phosphate synthase